MGPDTVLQIIDPEQGVVLTEICRIKRTPEGGFGKLIHKTVREPIKNDYEDYEWVVFHLTDDGLNLYNEGAEMWAHIIGYQKNGKYTVEEISRHKEKSKAYNALADLSTELRSRSIVFPVHPTDMRWTKYQQ